MNAPGNVKIGLISLRDAHWLGNAAAVAGGWVMVGDEWLNCSRLPDTIGMHIHNYRLAAIPDSITTVPLRPVDAALCVETLGHDIEHMIRMDRGRNGHYAECAEIARIWRDRIAAIGGDK